MEPFLGQISTFGFNFAPRGWAECNGQLLSIAQNTALFSLLGTMYGGDGRTTFALPDLRGRVAINAGHGPGLPSYQVGERGGTPATSILVQNLPAHHHSISPSTIPYNTEGADSGTVLTDLAFNSDDAENSLAVSGATQTGNVGSNVPINNMQPFLGVTVCIALVGTFPSRN